MYQRGYAQPFPPRRYQPYPRPAYPVRAPGPAVYAAPRVLPPTAAVARPPAPAVAAGSAPAHLNPKSKLNEWLQRHGYQAGLPYTTVNSPGGGFQSTIELPIDGAEGQNFVTGVGATKKDAESQCAAQGLEIIAGLGLLDAAPQVVSNKAAKSKSKLPQYVPSPAAPLASYAAAAPASAAGLAPYYPENNQDNFEALKQLLLEKVTQLPGKRASTYLMMFPATEIRKRIQAALYALERDGQLAKTEPTQGRSLCPFWHPVGYTGPLGGTVEEEALGEGRSFPLSDVKATLFDVLANNPHKTCIELMSLCARQGCNQERKVIQAALYQMEREGHARKTLNTTPGAGRKWPYWEVILPA